MASESQRSLYLSHASLLLACLVLLAITAWQAVWTPPRYALNTAANRSVGLSLSPDQQTAAVNQQVSVAVSLDSAGLLVDRAQVSLSFPDSLHFDGIANGERGCVTILQQLAADITLSCVTDPSSHTSQITHLTTLRFTTTRAGTAVIHFLPPGSWVMGGHPATSYDLRDQPAWVVIH